MIELNTLSVAGTPTQMGNAQGEHWRELIQRFVAVREAAVDVYTRLRGRKSGADGLLEIGRRSMAISAEWDPAGYAEHLGIAEGAQVDPVVLYTATNMTDMRDALILGGPPQAENPPADAEGCSSLVLPGALTANGAPLAGQTWDLNPTDVEYVVGVKRTPIDGPQTWSVTCAGCLSLVGINAYGVAVGTTNVKTWGSRPGVGYLALLHRALHAPDARTATEWISQAPRAGAHTYWLVDGKQQFALETSPDRIRHREAADAALCQTNHCLLPEHVARQGEAPSDSSHARYARLEAVSARGGHTVESLKALFADRSDGILSINRYAEDEQGTATNSVFIAEPAARRAFACRGPADRGRWVELAF